MTAKAPRAIAPAQVSFLAPATTGAVVTAPPIDLEGTTPVAATGSVIEPLPLGPVGPALIPRTDEFERKLAEQLPNFCNFNYFIESIFAAWRVKSVANNHNSDVEAVWNAKPAVAASDAQP